MGDTIPSLTSVVGPFLKFFLRLLESVQPLPWSDPPGHTCCLSLILCLIDWCWPSNLSSVCLPPHLGGHPSHNFKACLCFMQEQISSWAVQNDLDPGVSTTQYNFVSLSGFWEVHREIHLENSEIKLLIYEELCSDTTSSICTEMATFSATPCVTFCPALLFQTD